MLACFVFSSCNGTDSVTERNGFTIFPDYTDVTIPYNIAPLNFDCSTDDKVVINIKGQQTSYSKKHSDGKVRFAIRKWKRMLSMEKGNTLYVTITGASKDTLLSTRWFVSADAIDPYLSYRLIDPSYVIWDRLDVVERNMETFDTRYLSNNNITQKKCMNCHISNGSNTSFFHLRGAGGGTLVNRNGQLTKYNMKHDSLVATAAYGAPSFDGRYAVFTAADISLFYCSAEGKREEVYDNVSDLAVVDFENGTITDAPSVKGDEYQETFPCFSVDGKTIYFCRTKHLPQPENTDNMRYSLCSVDFDPENGKIGNTVRILLDGDRMNCSFNQPRVSPDGRFLVINVSRYGTFPVWHKECDMLLYNLATGKMKMLNAANSSNSDSHPVWSSNSRWCVFASKRDDNVYGRPYITHIDEYGNETKAFVLPQKNPNVYVNTLKSYNLPEIYTAPEPYDAHYIESFYNNIKSVNLTYKR